MSPSPDFLRKSLRFCLPPLAVSAQKRTANVEKSRCNKKRALLFGRMRAKSLVDIFRKMG